MMRAVIALVVVLVIVAGIFMMQNRGGAESTVQNPSTPPPQVQIVKAETHVITCSEPDYLEDTFTDKEGNVTKVFEIGKSSEGTEMTFLHSPKWLNKCQLDSDKDKAD